MKTAKHYPSSSNPQMSKLKAYELDKSLVRISKVEWKQVIHTRRGLESVDEKKVLSVS